MQHAPFMTIYESLQYLQKLRHMILNYAKNSNLERFSKGEQQEDLRT